MTDPDVRVSAAGIVPIAAQLVALGDQLRGDLAAAGVDAAGADAPHGFTTSLAASWFVWRHPADAVAPATALFGDQVEASAQAWQQADAAVAGALAGAAGH